MDEERLIDWGKKERRKRDKEKREETQKDLLRVNVEKRNEIRNFHLRPDRCSPPPSPLPVILNFYNSDGSLDG